MIVNTKEIEDVKFSSPELLSSHAKEDYIRLIKKRDDIQAEMWNLRQTIYKLEKNKKEVEHKINLLNTFIESIKYKTEEIDIIQNECNLAIINDSDYRNKH